MTRLGWIKLILEALVSALLLWIFPFPIDLKIKFLIVFVLMQLLCGRYRHKAFLIWDEARYLVQAYAGIFFTSLLLLPYRPFSWQLFWLLVLYVLIDFVFVILINRYAHLWFWKDVSQKVLIIGTGETAAQVFDVCAHNRFSLLDVQGFVNVKGTDLDSTPDEPVCVKDRPIYPYKDLDRVLADKRIDTVLIALPGLKEKQMAKLDTQLKKQVEQIKYLPLVDDLLNFNSQINDFDGLLMVSTSTGTINAAERFFKRICDIVCSIPGMLLVVPLYFYVRHINRKNGDYDPVFFVQKRIGRNGKLFDLYKFRTMIPNAEQVLEEMMRNDPKIREEYLKNRKLNDPRITQAGRFLRKTSLDEFPQFVNVFKGNMSLIGPRPYLPGEKADMGEIYEEIIATKPGITGMWQTHGRSSVDFQKRLELDSYYYNNWNPWLDVTLFIRTLKNILDHEDAGM